MRVLGLQLKVTVATLEMREPAGNRENGASAPDLKIMPGVENGAPRGFGFETVHSLSMLTR